MKLCFIVSLMNLSNCQGLSLTAVSPLTARMAPWAPEIHRGINLLKPTVELSFGKMCIRTYSCKEMRKVGVRVGDRGKSWPTRWSASATYGELRAVPNWVIGTMYPLIIGQTAHWKRASPWMIWFTVAETISSRGLSQYSQELRALEPWEGDLNTAL